MIAPVVLTETAKKVWEAVRAGPKDVADVVQTTQLDQSLVMVAALEAQQQGFFDVKERVRLELDPVPDAAARLQQGLPERQALRLLIDAGGSLSVPDFTQRAQAQGLPVHEIFRWGSARGWVERTKGQPPMVRVTDAGRLAVDEPADDERALRLALEGTRFLDEQALQGVDPVAVEQLLGKRTDLAKLRKRTQRILSLTTQGLEALSRAKVKREQNALAPEDFQSGAWRDITLRPYDVTLPGKTVYPAKIHPLRKIMEQTRRAFLELGFEEVVSPMVESAFWNFDALFQPQDHPARDMQDTFYMLDPARIPLPPPEVVEPVRRTHEHGGDTGSTGWGYKWSEREAERVVLRTHTTAATIRALAAHPNPPYKAFCVGWTYRNETISFKHLPVFHQIEGIVIDEQASLATLLGTLTAFYQKMGFAKVRFKPAFYPYTEPSVDVMVYMESRGKWIEMGGSGIFRPEVSEPFGCKHPVLAWGLGLERLAMLRLGFSDIRQLYQGSLDAMEEVALCR
ncbi:MAG TPA: phenylalanine--tRNA ligase subunit alpha [Polyangiaceae bacterium]|jgi:phenylalanyl-tRNA synthetase alpha chain|nr:MAG: Phenylalanine--tRNA ligase alpha subunit [Deltaproteobacteria bacterium ADurb.Bin207]HNS95863.1 phenylalanine--tRNA ligase subunit alpha [Polyangiaceae bacterium]HNZ21502.1 phenylalanine--tRNA ligase subunit alpha [Polyangiaceae bacterium]HOD25396.1 phenylalanine--tRNA ligase subunit alpha [Polyangiaceae bacterium]HOE51372.1 phenylalanine--tRNA ligase subunit alpha [Polyangiaceae bacterium]